MSADAVDIERPDSDVDVDRPSVAGSRPHFSKRQVRLAEALERLDSALEIQDLLDWLSEPAEFSISVGRPEVRNRAAGLGRAGMIGVLAWPRLSTRLGIGLETPLAHTLVDRLLGFGRQTGEERLQITPVEWGILSFAVAGTLARQAQGPGPLGDWDLLVDRVGSEAFSVEGLGSITTIRWPVTIEGVDGSLRLWAPDSVVDAWLDARSESRPAIDVESVMDRLGDLTSEWRAEAGTIGLSEGLSALREGLVLPIAGSPLRGSIESPEGEVSLVLRDPDGLLTLRAEPEPQSGAARLVVHPPVRRALMPRETASMASADPSAPVSSASELPVTLCVELGRLSLPLGRLSELKPGDVVDLAREPGAPVDLTSGGRLVARGELVEIDDELGVRVTRVFV